MAREPAHPVHPLFVDRWSPRSFTAEAPDRRPPLAETVLAGRLGVPAFADERSAA